MKNLLVILILLGFSFSLTGQAQERRLFKKKKDKIELESSEFNETTEPDLVKVGKHIKNAGWSILGSLIVVPIAIASNLDSGASSPSTSTSEERFENFVSISSIYASIGLVLNTGAQAIKAGWELKKAK